MDTSFSRTRQTWLAYILLAFYAYFLNILGPITPFLKEDLNLSYTVSSFHFTAFALGILFVGLGGQHVIHHLGSTRSLWGGAIGMSVSSLLLLAGRIPLVTIGASLTMGLIGSLILASVPSLLSERHGEQRAVALSEANMISSLVASTAPLLVGLSVRFSGSWKLSLGIAALAPFLLAWAFRGSSSPKAAPESKETNWTRQPLPGLYWVFWLALVMVISVEFCMIFWSADFLENALGMAKVNAAQSVSVFLAAMILGRFTGSRLVKRIPAHRLVTASLLLAGAGFIVYWQAESTVLGIGGLFLTGLGVANLYPLVLSLAIGTSPGDPATASARATLASGTAILALPLALGRLADVAGIRQAYAIVALLLLIALVILQLAGRFTRIPVKESRVGNQSRTRSSNGY
jgi:fucose permease